MKHHKTSHGQAHKTAGDTGPAAAADLTNDELDFSPAPDEVARRAYFSYVNTGSLPGHDVQHWLAAEAALIADRNRTRTHGFHNQT